MAFGSDFKKEEKTIDSFHLTLMDNYRPQRSCEGYAFTPVCQSFCSQGGGVSWGVLGVSWGMVCPRLCVLGKGVCPGGG